MDFMTKQKIWFTNICINLMFEKYTVFFVVDYSDIYF